MILSTRVGLLAGAAAMTLTGVSVAGTDAEAQDYEARIAELEAQVAALTTGENWMTEERAEEIRGLVQDVLADADTRASLLSTSLQGGYDDGFVIGSSDGNFGLRINGQLQTRLIWNMQDAATGSSTDEDRRGFENARTKLMFSGNVGGPDWMYYIEADFARDGGDFTLDDAWIGHDFGNGWKVMMGQTKVPLNREFLVHSSKQLAVERSNVSYLYNGGRTQGIMADYADDQWHFVFAFTDGAENLNTPWSDYDTEWSWTARAEFLLSGNWQQFEDFTSPMGSEQGVMVGVGFHWQKDEYGTPGPFPNPPGEDEFWILSGDVSMEFDGANIFASISYADFDNADVNPLGIVAQGGYYFADDLEGFVRYEWNDFDESGAGAADDLSLLTVGINKYYSPNVKATADFGYGFDTVDSSGVEDITGWRADDSDEDGQFVLRGQLQLTF